MVQETARLTWNLKLSEQNRLCHNPPPAVNRLDQCHALVRDSGLHSLHRIRRGSQLNPRLRITIQNRHDLALPQSCNSDVGADRLCALYAGLRHRAHLDAVADHPARSVHTRAGEMGRCCHDELGWCSGLGGDRKVNLRVEEESDDETDRGNRIVFSMSMPYDRLGEVDFTC